MDNFTLLKNLHKSYSGTNIFKDITFQLKKGEILSILGPSGCGKTTLLRCIAGLEELSGGEIWMEGEEVSHRSPQERPVVLMFQQPLLFPQMTALDNVTYGLKIKKIKRQERKKLGIAMLESIGMKDHAHKYPNELSGGQQQRIALGRALMMKPKLLLLDEPFSSLDPHLRVQLRSWLKDVLNEHEMTAIFVTHDKEEAMMIADRVGVMKDGRLQQIGSPKEVYYKPKNEIVASFFSDGILLKNHTFIPVHQIKTAQKAAHRSEVEYIFEGIIKGVTYKAGQAFYHIQIQDHHREGKILLPLQEERSMHETVTLRVNKKDIIQFEGEKDA